MANAVGDDAPERPGTVFFGLVTIITAIALEQLVVRVADVVRIHGWSLELALLAACGGFSHHVGVAWLQHGRHDHSSRLDQP